MPRHLRAHVAVGLTTPRPAPARPLWAEKDILLAKAWENFHGPETTAVRQANSTAQAMLWTNMFHTVQGSEQAQQLLAARMAFRASRCNISGGPFGQTRKYLADANTEWLKSSASRAEFESVKNIIKVKNR